MTAGAARTADLTADVRPAATRLAGAHLSCEAAAGPGTVRFSAVLPVGTPALSGHYPGYPIVPGVFLVEIAAAAEARHREVLELGDRWAGVRSVRFREPVFPGQRILLERTERRGLPRYTLSHEDGAVIVVVDLEVRGQGREPEPLGAAVPAAVPSAGAGEHPRPEQVLPHRPPMLLLDRVESVEPTVSLTATYTVTAGAGGVVDAGGAEQLPWPLVLESWAQAAAMLTTWDDPTPDVRTGSVLLFGGARDVRFGAAPRPSATLVHEVRLVADAGGAAVLAGSSRCDDQHVLEVGQLTIGRRPASSLPDPDQTRHQEVDR